MRNLMCMDLRLNSGPILALVAMLSVVMVYFAYTINTVESVPVLLILCCGYGSMLHLVILAREDKFGVCGFTCSLPIDRRSIILSRYILGWISSLLVTTFYILTIALVSPHIPAAAFLNPGYLLAVFLLLGIMLAISIPPVVRYGLVGFFVLMGVVLVAGNATMLIVRMVGDHFKPRYILLNIVSVLRGLESMGGTFIMWAASILFALLLTYLSYRLSLRLFSGREM